MAYKISKKPITYRNKGYSLSEYYGMAKEKGMNHHDALLFSMFMVKRFPKEWNEDYVNEWIGRFKTGKPDAYMDEESKSAYLKAREELDGI